MKHTIEHLTSAEQVIISFSTPGIAFADSLIYDGRFVLVVAEKLGHYWNAFFDKKTMGTYFCEYRIRRENGMFFYGRFSKIFYIYPIGGKVTTLIENGV